VQVLRRALSVIPLPGSRARARFARAEVSAGRALDACVPRSECTVPRVSNWTGVATACGARASIWGATSALWSRPKRDAEGCDDLGRARVTIQPQAPARSTGASTRAAGLGPANGQVQSPSRPMHWPFAGPELPHSVNLTPCLGRPTFERHIRGKFGTVETLEEDKVLSQALTGSGDIDLPIANCRRNNAPAGGDSFQLRGATEVLVL